MTKPPTFHKHVTEKTKAELAEGIAYMMLTPGYARFGINENPTEERTCLECGRVYEGHSLERYCGRKCRDTKDARMYAKAGQRRKMERRNGNR